MISLALKSSRDVRNLFLWVHKASCHLFWAPVAKTRVEYSLREWLQPSLSSDHRTGSAFWFVRQIQIFELRLGISLQNCSFEFFGELSLALDRLEDRLAAVLHLNDICVAFLNCRNLNFVQGTGFLFGTAQ